MITNDARGVRNGSGYVDPVMSEAFDHIQQEDAKASALIRRIKREIQVSGYELLERIAIRDVRTGREYR